MTKEIKVKNIIIGGNAPVSVQSMTNTDTANYQETAEQIKRLHSAGCDIIRIAVRDERDLDACKRYVADFSNVPLVADIQYDYKLAVSAADIGFSKVRYNPGNTNQSGLTELVAACKANGTPIRIGINGGSLEKDILSRLGRGADALMESALRSVRLFEAKGFNDIIVSVKSSDAKIAVDAYRKLSESCDYPLHLGITESGHGDDGIIKSAIGIGSLLLDGIGDTVRVSLTGDPVNEVIAAHKILRALKLKEGVDIVSCPTCARCHYDLEGMVVKCKKLALGIKKPLKIAIMGCVVNGPGEASDADIGIAGGQERSIIFKRGEKQRILPTAEAEALFISEVEKLIRE